MRRFDLFCFAFICGPALAQSNSVPTVKPPGGQAGKEIAILAMPVPAVQTEKLFEGVALTKEQQEKIVGNLGQSLSQKVMQYLPNGQGILETPGVIGGHQVIHLMQMSPGSPIPGGAPDACAIAFTQEQLAPLRILIAYRLRETKQDVAAFEANIPQKCVRKELDYYLRIVQKIAN
jgi:hypothetical protein